MTEIMMKSIIFVLAVFASQSAGQGYGTNVKDSVVQPQLIQEYGLQTQNQPELLGNYKQPGNSGFGVPNEPQLVQQNGGYNSMSPPAYGPIQGGSNTYMQPLDVGNYGANPALISQVTAPESYKVPNNGGYGSSTGAAYTQPQIQPAIINSGSGYGQPQIQPAVVNSGYGQSQIQPAVVNSGYGQPQIQPAVVNSGYGQPQLVQQTSNGYRKPQREDAIIFKPAYPSSSPSSYGQAMRPHNHGQSQYSGNHRRPQSYSPQAYGRPQIQTPSHSNPYNGQSGYGNNNAYGASAPVIQPRPSY